MCPGAMAEDRQQRRYRRRATAQLRLRARCREDAKQGLVERRLRHGRAPLRPDERPDVGRPAPAVEGRPGRLARAAARRAALRAARRRRRHRRRRLARARRRRRRRPRRALRHQRGDDRRRPRAAANARLASASTSSQGNAEALPFADRSFDAYTIAFGIRNVTHIERGAARGLSRAEARRALPVPRILQRRGAAARPALRRLFLQRRSRRSASWSPATRRPIAIWSRASAASPIRRASRD